MSFPETAAKSGGAPVGTILLLVLAVMLYAAMMGSLSDVSHTDAAGRGIATAFGALFATVLLFDLAILLVVAAVKGQMSIAGRIGSFIVVPAATVAIWMAADALGNRDRSAIWVPALLPPVIALYALRARFAPLRAGERLRCRYCDGRGRRRAGRRAAAARALPAAHRSGRASSCGGGREGAAGA